jgi:S-formylglutathione hydrolase FrmB
MAAIEMKSIVKCFNGKLIRFTHASTTNNCPMTCAVYLPPQAAIDNPVPGFDTVLSVPHSSPPPSPSLPYSLLSSPSINVSLWSDLYR